MMRMCTLLHADTSFHLAAWPRFDLNVASDFSGNLVASDFAPFALISNLFHVVSSSGVGVVFCIWV